MKKSFLLILLLSCSLASLSAEAATHHKKHKKIDVHKVHKKQARQNVHQAPKAVAHANVHRAQPSLQSNIALIVDEKTGQEIYNKHAELQAPIASITKLMTAMVVLDAKPDMNAELSVAVEDLDTLKGTTSRLRVGMTFTRAEMLQMALMASENRAASALARAYPGGMAAAIASMNAKARQLGMNDTKFFDPTGLNSDNVSTAQDLAKMVAAAQHYPLIHQYTTTATTSVDGWHGRELRFSNTNPLVKNASWNIGVSKTGFINEAGRCLVMAANINQRPVIIVLLNSWGKSTRIGDANRIKKWMEARNSLLVNS